MRPEVREVVNRINQRIREDRYHRPLFLPLSSVTDQAALLAMAHTREEWAAIREKERQDALKDARKRAYGRMIARIRGRAR